jgi:hypothetical protein
MVRFVIALAIAAPLLSGCIIISSEKPTTRVIHSSSTEAPQ